MILQNAASRELAGGRDLEGQPVRSLPITACHPNGKPLRREEAPLTRLLAGEKVSDQEYVITYPDGRHRQLLSSGHVVRDDSGGIVLAILVTRDVTQLRQMERLREDFVRIAAHDMRQPLSVVATTAEVLRRSLQAQALQKEAGQAERIVGNGARMARMIGELVDSARLEAGTMRLEMTALDLGALVRDAVENLGVVPGNGRIEVRVADGVPAVSGDRAALQRVVENLVTNALKYGTPGSAVTVSVAASGRGALLSVADRGPGIPADELEQVFQRYFRTRSGEQSEGLGLGLYISRLLVEEHGGQIGATSRPGEGTTFEVLLPAGHGRSPGRS